MVNRKRDARITRERETVGITRRKSRSLTRQDRTAPSAPDLILRDFTAPMPGLKSVGEHHLPADGRGVAVPGDGDRSVHAGSRGLVDGRPHADNAPAESYFATPPSGPVSRARFGFAGDLRVEGRPHGRSRLPVNRPGGRSRQRSEYGT
ncbi:hypothetical protein [Streptomyces sp. NBC_01244]|uniref:hypothetical protein n=1 Tax=Streptomyces sp. NBC_01244 TaxID=2903797 RepID=UPI003FA3BA7E